MKKELNPAAIQRAFGADSRSQLLKEYFANASEVTSANAWKHIYRLLLWIDRSTALAHCYESDKAQPGRPWYARSLAFHDWVSQALGVSPSRLGEEIDWLFTRVTERLAGIMVGQQAPRAAFAAEQRAPYKGRGFPEPGEDPGLEALIREELDQYFSSPPATPAMRHLTQRIHAYLTTENKRKNLVGEGFEDVLTFLIGRLPGAAKLKVTARPVLHSLPGFRQPRGAEKPRKVDVAIITPREQRVLLSVKWSIRADREEQFGVDFATYTQLEGAGLNFDFVLITNEFDAARLTAACERRGPNTLLFTSVVHVNPEGPVAAYGLDPRHSAKKLIEHTESGRLTSLERWLATLVSS